MDLNFGAILALIGFSDVVDIVIMSFVIYKLMGFIRDSRAAQLSKGLLFIIGAFFLSDAAHLYTFNWVLARLMNIGLIALVVVFQPELRRGLEYLGKNKLLNRSSIDRESINDIVEQISAAVGYFASIKEGALIVIERDIAVNDIAENGTIIDAKLSQELLENLFYVGSPLHDGAVIIRRDRIYSAGCVLPLTENTNLSKDLGTRHRAGIGISEVTDAIVLIVSEETGIISMAQEGKLSRFLDVRTVEKTLLNYYITKLPSENEYSLRKFISNIWRPGNDEKQDD